MTFEGARLGDHNCILHEGKGMGFHWGFGYQLILRKKSSSGMRRRAGFVTAHIHFLHGLRWGWEGQQIKKSQECILESNTITTRSHLWLNSKAFGTQLYFTRKQRQEGQGRTLGGKLFLL